MTCHAPCTCMYVHVPLPLQAVVYLYDQGFPALGHIQTGNIFVNVTKTEVKLGVGEGEESGIPKGAGSSIQEGVGPGIRDGMESEDTGLKMGPEDGAEKGEGLVDAGEEAKSAVCVHMEDVDTYCRLGGHENTLLGYRPRLYRNIVNAGELERIDIISFGHVMYEIGCGCELEGVCPTDAEYAEISDVNFSSVLRKIFDHKMSVSEVLSMPRWQDNSIAIFSVDADVAFLCSLGTTTVDVGIEATPTCPEGIFKREIQWEKELAEHCSQLAIQFV